ncbi:MAG: TetR/AcrR family transcriptional regulator [bacterium]
MGAELKSTESSSREPLSCEPKAFLQLQPEKQKRVLEAAVKEFAEKGYGRASMNLVVERAGISKGALFKYFGSKGGLFAFVYRMALERIKGYLKAVRDQSRGEPFFSRLEKVMWAGVLFIQENPGLARIYQNILFTGDSPYKAGILEELQRESVEFIQGLIQDGIQRGDLRADLDPVSCAFVIQCVLDRFLQAHHLPFLGPGLGLHQASQETSRQWIGRLLDLMENGMGSCRAQKGSAG